MMKILRNDRFLLGILIAIGLLVVLALALFFSRQRSPGYLPGDDPGGVVHNYALALDRGEFEKAYTYLPEGEDKPSLAKFISFLTTTHPSLENAGLQITSVEEKGEIALVNLLIIHVDNDIFDSGWRESAVAILEKKNGTWKIQELPYPYWNYDWYKSKTTRP